MASENEQVVGKFMAAWSRRNLDEIMSFFDDDAVYHNIPMAPARGKDAIKGAINTFLPMAKSIEFKVLTTTAGGNLVMNERVDIFDLGGKRIELPVAGAFEIRQGKIAAWRDYFDLASWTKQMS